MKVQLGVSFIYPLNLCPFDICARQPEILITERFEKYIDFKIVSFIEEHFSGILNPDQSKAYLCVSGHRISSHHHLSAAAHVRRRAQPNIRWRLKNIRQAAQRFRR